MAEEIDPSEVVLNRRNLTEARSRKVLLSWLPSSTATGLSTSPGQTANASTDDNDEADYGTMDDPDGIGSKRALKDNDAVDEPLRKKRPLDEKLLEQLLGKKKAMARKQDMAETRGFKSVMGSTIPGLVKPMAQKDTGVKHRPTVSADVAGDEDEGGRAVALTSRKKARMPVKSVQESETNGEATATAQDNEDDENRSQERPSIPPATSKAPARKKATSYLDELLAQKAGKKKKKKKKQQDQTGTADY